MVNATEFPAAFWGKSEKAGAMPQGNGVLARDADFPESLLPALEAAGRSFEWNSTDDEALAACYAWWPTESGGLVLRILDMGPDDQGRPHSVRIEAVFVDSPTVESVGCWLHADAWPVRAWNYRRGTRLLLYGQSASPEVEQGLGRSLAKPMALAVHDGLSCAACVYVIRGGDSPAAADGPPVDSAEKSLEEQLAQALAENERLRGLLRQISELSGQG